MKILIKRPVNFIGRDTIGDLFLNGKWWCFTLEDMVRPPGVKIKGETAIPVGTYKIRLDFSSRWKRDMPHILNVPMFTNIRIHGGNTNKATEGCILVGKERGQSSIWNCKPALEGIITALSRASDEENVIEII